MFKKQFYKNDNYCNRLLLRNIRRRHWLEMVEERNKASSSDNTHYVRSDSEDEEIVLLQEINYLRNQVYALRNQMRRKYHKLEEVRIRRAVKRRESQMKEQTRKFLPTLENVIVHRDRILRNSNTDDNSDSDSDIPPVEKVFTDLFFNKDKK